MSFTLRRQEIRRKERTYRGSVRSSIPTVLQTGNQEIRSLRHLKDNFKTGGTRYH